MNLLRIFPAAIVFATAACAGMPGSGSYVHVAYPEMMFSAADYTADVDAVVKSAGWADRTDTIKAAMNEKGAWPAKMKDESARWLQMETIKSYNTVELGRLSFYDQPAVLLHVPAAANQHMKDGWKPAADFFMIVGTTPAPK
ncbi:MAG: hypothetical protein EON93_05900 [Burkholderiales bacterium]|nr:MAG: hypothetical protein EON93_05900 [Burkholderiales bacterium]